MSRFKKFGIVPVLLAILLFTVGGTVAFLIAESNEVENSFGAYEISCKVNETFNEATNEKSNVYVTNSREDDTYNGLDKAYIRAKLIPYWYAEKTDQIIAKNPWVPDIKLAANSKWVLGTDGFYYYTEPVTPGEDTEVLISSLKLTADENDGSRQVLNIIASAIQADGEGTAGKPVVQAWGSNGGGSVTGVEANGNLRVATAASGTGSGQ